MFYGLDFDKTGEKINGEKINEKETRGGYGLSKRLVTFDNDFYFKPKEREIYKYNKIVIKSRGQNHLKVKNLVKLILVNFTYI